MSDGSIQIAVLEPVAQEAGHPAPLAELLSQIMSISVLAAGTWALQVYSLLLNISIQDVVFTTALLKKNISICVAYLLMKQYPSEAAGEPGVTHPLRKIFLNQSQLLPSKKLPQFAPPPQYAMLHQCLHMSTNISSG